MEESKVIGFVRPQHTYTSLFDFFTSQSTELEEGGAQVYVIIFLLSVVVVVVVMLVFQYRVFFESYYF